MAPDDPPIRSTAASFAVVEAVHERGGATLPELVEALDRPESTVHDHLQTLVELGYLVREGRSYRVGFRFLELGGRARSGSPLFRVAESEVRALAEETGEHANLLVEEEGRGVFLFKATGDRSVSLDTYEGMRVDLHTTALGKAVLAELPAERRARILDRQGLARATENTITSRDELVVELNQVRKQGYATDDGERIVGVRCVGAAVTTDTKIHGAVSVSAPRGRLTGDRFTDELPAAVRNTANVIEVELAHR